ncbi:RagB/SusD family nutrient uptake outer membrane protein [Spirosoma endbachense]|uniref:RagB/SusD family nutrient uptake outer membrane protein n=1 Tax=Spirosoma endbachense TaxID=2666025 RepID=A0A6P1W4H7_9BACT|nr:RagB/SusD family nutrient uptake outer membrane protein [Spirosoma endbachense]QHW00334.1 RagB/SusD family nutrient uptake outer membrane protein [Spirosoma endbachense]
MKTQYTIYLYARFTGLFLLVSGCDEKFVDLTPQDVIPVQQYYKTEADIRSALTGTYGNLRGIYNSFWQYTELPSDNTQSFPESESGSGEYDKLTWRSTSAGVSTAWNDAYRTIAGANVILARIESVTMDATLKNQYIGEAKFLRALMYFNLVRLFDGVPIILKEITSEAEAYTYTRNTAAEVYAQIEKDLLDAEKILPAKYTGTNVGRATSGAAKSLLGKVYVQEKKYAEAAAKLAEVVNSGIYRILPNLADVFGVGKDNNDEIVFGVQYVSSGFGEGNSYAYVFAPGNSGTQFVGVTAGGTNIGTQDLYDAFEAGDLRRDAFLGVYKFGGNALIYYWSKKFVYKITQLNEGENDWPVLRYADVVLLYAEALNQTGKTTEALAQINVIRKRAGLANLSGLSAADTQLSVEKERRLELCFEGHRWHDLIRWGKDVATMQAFKAKYSTLDVALKNMSVAPERKLFPIPFREISLNAAFTQNPGY